MTIIIVSYKQVRLIKRALESIREFYPRIRVIVIDGSPSDDPAVDYLWEMEDPYTDVLLLYKNIGHGEGMNEGIDMVNGHRFVIMDSDAVLVKPNVLEDMDKQLKSTSYGIGQVVNVDERGNNGGDIPYLHPHFAMINRKQYLKNDKFIHHGAPLLKTMKNLTIPIQSFPVSDYVYHEGRGTRIISPKEFNPFNWDKNV